MGIVSDIVVGRSKAKAAKRAAGAQQAAADQASALQETAKDDALERSRLAEEKARADLQPFTDAGKRALPGLEKGLADVSRLVSDPNAQREFITNNPFFDALAERSTETLLSNTAARGKVGSGGTAEALQKSILLLGSDLLNQNITQRQNTNTQFQNLVNTGVGTASNQANITQNTVGRDVGTLTGVAQRQGDLRLASGEAQASGIVGASNARTGIPAAIEQGLVNAAKMAASAAGGGVQL